MIIKIFSMIKNFQLYKEIFKLTKNKFCNFKKKKNNENLNLKEYNLIINCDSRNQITKKFFYKNLKKIIIVLHIQQLLNIKN